MASTMPKTSNYVSYQLAKKQIGQCSLIALIETYFNQFDIIKKRSVQNYIFDMTINTEFFSVYHPIICELYNIILQKPGSNITSQALYQHFVLPPRTYVSFPNEGKSHVKLEVAKLHLLFEVIVQRLGYNISRLVKESNPDLWNCNNVSFNNKVDSELISNIDDLISIYKKMTGPSFKTFYPAIFQQTQQLPVEYPKIVNDIIITMKHAIDNKKLKKQ